MNRFKELRAELGLSQKEFSDILFVNQTAVSQWERGVTTPNSNILFKICDLYNVSIDYLLGREQKEKLATQTDSEFDPLLQEPIDLEFAEKFSHLTSEQKKWMLAQIDGIINHRESESPPASR